MERLRRTLVPSCQVEEQQERHRHREREQEGPRVLPCPVVLSLRRQGRKSHRGRATWRRRSLTR